MSYVVLARKWRPMKFQDVVSQEHVTTTLENAIQNDRLASAYLFSGPRGVGKTTSARIFAKAINCDNGPTPTPCNTCSSCSDITAGRSLDVFEIDGASSRGIDEVRNLRENLKYAASKGKHKIYIIDEVHMLTTEAFNALLKTLEEPPPNVLFIFATTEFHKVPATVLSRCQRYDFRRIPINEIVEKLESICKEEKIKIGKEPLYVIAKKADGSLRDSQSILDQVISFCGQDIKSEDIANILGVIDYEFFFECSDAITNKDVESGLKITERVFTQGYDMAEFLNGLSEHFRNLLVVKATGNCSLLEGLETYSDRYKGSASSFNETDFMRLIQIASDTSFQIKRSANPKLLLEMAMIKMIKMDRSVELKTLLSNLGGKVSPPNVDKVTPAQTPGAKAAPIPAPSAKVAPVSAAESVPVVQANQPSQPVQESPAMPVVPAQEANDTVVIKQLNNVIKEKSVEYNSALPTNNNSVEVSETPPPSENTVVSFEKIKADWLAIIEEVKAKKIHLGSFLNEGFPTNLKDSILEISFGKENGFHMRSVDTNKVLVQKVIFEKTGFQVKLHCHKNESDEFNQIQTQRRDNPPELVQPQPSTFSQSPLPAPDPAESMEYVEPAEDEALQIPILKKVIEVFDGEIVNK